MDTEATNKDDLRERLRNLPRTSRTDTRYPIDAYEDDLVQIIIQYGLEQRKEAEQETIKLASHLAYMAGEFEGMTGHKSAYLLKNWPAYKSMSEQRERNHV